MRKTEKLKTWADATHEERRGAMRMAALWTSSEVEGLTAILDRMIAADRQTMGEKGYEFLCENYTVENTYHAIVSHLVQGSRFTVQVLSRTRMARIIRMRVQGNSGSRLMVD